jgi:hypothetical protein
MALRKNYAELHAAQDKAAAFALLKRLRRESVVLNSKQASGVAGSEII